MFLIEYETDYPILHEARSAVPEMTLELGTVHTAFEGERPAIRLQILAYGGDFAAFEAALARDETVADFTCRIEGDDRRFYRIEYTQDAMRASPYPVWTGLDGHVLEAKTIDAGWTVQMRFPDREAVSRYRAWHEDRGFRFDLKKLSTNSIYSTDAGPSKLTDKQRETLLLAYDLGYYEVPSTTELAELARELGISDSAVAQRLKRGMASLIEEAFGKGE